MHLDYGVQPRTPLSARRDVCDTSADMSAYQLEIHRRDRPVETREFDGAKVTIGRESGDLALHDPEVSSRHGELVFTGTELTYIDLNSTNGTFDATGARIREPKVLAVGAALRMGRTTILLTRVGARPVPEQLPVSKTIFAPGGVPRPAVATPSPATAPTRLPPPGGAPAPSSAGSGVNRLPPPGAASSMSATDGSPVPTVESGDVGIGVNPFAASTPGTDATVAGLPRPPGQPSAQLPPPGGASAPARLPPPTGSHAPVSKATDHPVPVAEPGHAAPVELTAPAIARSTTPTPVNPAGMGSGGSGLGRLPPPSGLGPTTGSHATVTPDPLADTLDHAFTAGSDPGGDEARAATEFDGTGTIRSPTYPADEVGRAYGDDTMGIGDEIRTGWAFVSPVLMTAALPLVALFVGSALVELVLGWIPVVGGLLGILLGGVQLVFTPLATGVLFYVLIKARLGQTVELRDAWMTVYRRADVVWTNLFVASLIAGIAACFLVVPGIAVGFFIGPVFFVEDRRFLDINAGAFEHFKQRVPQILLLSLGIGLVVLLAWAPAAALMKAGAVGMFFGRVFGVVATLVATVGMSLLAAISVQMYFRLRGDEALELAATKLAAFEGSTVTMSPATADDAASSTAAPPSMGDDLR